MTRYGFQVGPQSTCVKAHHTKYLLVEECNHHPHKFRYTFKIFMLFFSPMQNVWYQQICFRKYERDELSQSEYYKTATVLLSAPTIAHCCKEVSHPKIMHKAQTNYKNWQDINPP